MRRTVITTHVDVNVIYQSKSHHLIMMTRSPNYCSAVISALNKRGGAYLHLVQFLTCSMFFFRVVSFYKTQTFKAKQKQQRGNMYRKVSLSASTPNTEEVPRPRFDKKILKWQTFTKLAKTITFCRL